MSLGHLRHLWKARGRHGTHSPFVYAFIETVLRDNLPIPVVEKDKMAFPGLNYLLKTIRFLEIEHLVCFHPELLPLKHVMGSVFPDKNLFTVTNRTTTPPHTLMLADASRLHADELDYLKSQVQEPPFYLYFLLPHVKGSPFNNGKTFRDWKNYMVSLDFWNGLLLCRHTDFKQKQHFLLR